MKNFIRYMIILAAVVLYSQSGNAQRVISQFTWSSNPTTKADVGPDAISISSAAVISAYGTGQFGLNAGTPATDINMTLPASIFNVKGMEVAIDFRREESVASLFQRGSYFDFGMNGGNLYIKFTVANSTGGVTTLNYTNLYAIPTDGQMHRYRFSYDNNTRVAEVSVDNVIRGTWSDPTWRDLAWNTTSNMLVGALMDGTGRNVAILDNMIITELNSSSTLPLKLLNFNATKESSAVKLEWKTANEYNVESINIERSADGKNFTTIGKVAAMNNNGKTNSYTYTDKSSVSGASYYRLKIQDIDGSLAYSEIKTVSTLISNAASIEAFPNPAKDFVNLKISGNNENYRISLYSLSGKMIKQSNITISGTQQVKFDLGAATGMYVLSVENVQSKKVENFKIQKI